MPWGAQGTCLSSPDAVTLFAFPWVPAKTPLAGSCETENGMSGGVLRTGMAEEGESGHPNEGCLTNSIYGDHFLWCFCYKCSKLMP